MAKKIGLLFAVAVMAVILGGCMFVNSSTHTISGYVKDVLGNGVANVQMRIDYPNGYKTTITDENGYWSESGIIGKTLITPQASEWTFEPASKTLTIDKDEKNVNFTADPLNYWVSGYVHDETGKAVSGVTITFESSQGEATPVKTDLSGFWKSGTLNGKVAVRAVKNGWLFTPTVFPVSGLETNVNFVALKGVGEKMYIPIEGIPGGLAVDEEGGRLFVSNSSTDIVKVFNVYGYNELYEYRIGHSPAGICYDPKDKLLFVANSATDVITVIDTTASPDKAKVNDVLIGGSPAGIAFDPKTNSVYVTNSYYNSVNVLSASPVGIVANVRLGKAPNDVAVNPITNMIYVTDKNTGSVSVINGSDNSLADDIKVGGAPLGIAVNYVTNEVYVVNGANDSVTVINGKTDEIVNTIKVGNHPSHVYVNGQKNMIYVTNTSDNTVSVIDGQTKNVIQTVVVGKGPTWISGNQKSGTVYVSNTDEKTISVIN
jgi:YVTN family beta-propeller protein